VWRHMKRCHCRLHYDRKFQIFIFLIGHINVNKGVFCLIISYLQIKSYNVLNYNNCSTDWPFPLSVFIWYKVNLIIFSLKNNLFSPWYRWKISELALNNNHSFTHCIVQPSLYSTVTLGDKWKMDYYKVSKYDKRCRFTTTPKLLHYTTKPLSKLLHYTPKPLSKFEKIKVLLRKVNGHVFVF
jgi:hypothetical protein